MKSYVNNGSKAKLSLSLSHVTTELAWNPRKHTQGDVAFNINSSFVCCFPFYFSRKSSLSSVRFDNFCIKSPGCFSQLVKLAPFLALLRSTHTSSDFINIWLIVCWVKLLGEKKKWQKKSEKLINFSVSRPISPSAGEKDHQKFISAEAILRERKKTGGLQGSSSSGTESEAR